MTTNTIITKTAPTSKSEFSGKTLLITGGTGSFGNAVFNRLKNFDFQEIRIFSRDEKKQHDMRMSLNDERVKFYIGDVKDYTSVSDAMTDVDYVFHAAALKQVPSCEFYPMEAVKTNIVGADNVMRAAEAHSIARCVVLSTDKAVYPINAMGMSKALMEKAMVARSRTAKKKNVIFAATRYGNVMGSRGSVIPLFADQIAAGQPLTITDPNMSRFLMSLDESVDLVLHTFRHGKPGDIFVQKAPACLMRTLISAMQEIAGKKCEVRVIGTRHGEKLYETLVSREEMARTEDVGAFYRVPADSRDLNYDKYFVAGEDMSNADDYHSHNAERLDEQGVVDLLKKFNVYLGTPK
jgi:UDP-N-acetylglucosamine 4,6-dehydratase/5-epimerase